MDGYYDVTFHTNFVGPISGRFIAESTETGLKANTRPGIAWRLVGGLEKVLGPLFAPYIFPSGMILTWESTLPNAQGPGKGTIGPGTISRLRTATTLPSPEGPIEIRWRDDNRLIGLVSVRKVGEAGQTPPQITPSVDYAALARSVEASLPRMIYDSALGTKGEFAAFATDLQEVATTAQDDVEFLVGCALAARKSVRTLFPLIYPEQTEDNAKLLASRTDAPTPQRITFDDAIATIRFDAFVEVEAVDLAFQEALAKNPRAIILDLRTCSGIELASLRAASWLFSSPVDGGTFFGQDARAKALSGTPAPHTINIDSGATTPALAESLRSYPHSAFQIIPAHTPFTGPVSLLTSRRTSSTAESLVSVLKTNKRVTHYGERTAGRPYLSTETSLGQRWMLRVAAFDYAPPSGPRFNNKGLVPDRSTSASAAAKAASTDLRRELGLPPEPDRPATKSGAADKNEAASANLNPQAQ